MKTLRHEFCCRECFVIDYRKRQKESSFPLWKCPSCNEQIKLDFEPIKDKFKWISLQCPHCGYCRLEESLGLDD